VSDIDHFRDNAVLEVRHLICRYAVQGRRFDAVADVSFDLQHAETLALVGESGCGKSTVCRAILQLPRPHGGSVRLNGLELTEMSERRLRPIRRQLQIVFQDPISSLNPRKRVRTILRQSAALSGLDPVRARIKGDAAMLDVGLDPMEFGNRKPHELSGGQCQRVALARALIADPEVLVCDEAVSALDVSVQAQILALLQRLKDQYGMALIFVSHDLAVVRQVATRVAVMYLGRVCEIGDSRAMYSSPWHPYTRALLDAVPHPDPDRPFTGDALEGEIPSPTAPPSGCRFRTRCPRAQDKCAVVEPMLRAVGDDQFVACHFPLGNEHQGLVRNPP
jgi:peptide/nickel transport system ATP-binding protein